jgi:hypothetical protein
MYEKVMDKVIQATPKLKELPMNRQLSALDAKILPYLRKHVEESTGPMKKVLSKAYNGFASIKDGIKSGEVSKKDFNELSRDLKKIKTELEGLVKAEAKAKEKAATPEDRNEADMISDSGEGRLGNWQAKGQEAMQKYRKYEQLVPARLQGKSFTAIKIPIVAVTDPILFKERLARFNLCDDTIFGYPFLKNQTLIGMSNDWVSTEFKRQIKPATADILDALYEKTKTRYVALGVAKQRKHVTWIWVASEREMRNLNAVASGGHFKVTGWDFPFEVKPKT